MCGSSRSTPRSTRSGGPPGLLIGSFLSQAAQVLHDIDVRDNARLATNILDLLSTAISARLEVRPDDVDRVQRSLLDLSLFYIEQHLADPRLAPGEIAAACHVSTRYLHKVFQREGTTVSAWIRGRRLEHCSHDLRDPALASRPVSAIAARWGLLDAAHFSRLFRDAFGTSPGEYRGSHPALSRAAGGP